MGLSESGIKTNRFLLLGILLLDLIGFSLLFPVIPDLLEFYLNHIPENSIDSWLPTFLDKMAEMLPESRRSKEHVIILFGGALGSLYSFLQFIVSPYWGRFSDRIGRRPVLLLTSSLLSLSYLVWALSQSFTAFILTRILAGLMAGNLGVASAAMADMSKPENRTREMGMLGAAFGVGFIIGPAIGGLASSWNLKPFWPGVLHPFSFCALLSFALTGMSALLNWRFFRETLSAKMRELNRKIRAGRNFGAALKNANLRYVILMNFLFLLLFSGFEFTVTFVYKLEFGLAPHEIGFIFFYLGLLLALGQGGLVRMLTPIIGEKTLILIGLAVLAVPLYFFGLSAPSTALSMLALLPIAIGASMIQPSLTGMASLFSHEAVQGRTLGAFRSAGSLARALGPLAGAYFYWLLGLEIAYLWLAVLMGIVFLIGMGLKSPQRKRIDGDIS